VEQCADCADRSGKGSLADDAASAGRFDGKGPPSRNNAKALASCSFTLPSQGQSAFRFGITNARQRIRSDQTDSRSNSRCRLSIPAELQAFSEPCDLLPGESRRDFEAIRQRMVDDVQPQTNIEWLWTLDLLELSWEILHYRSLKQRVSAEYRHSAIRAILLRLDGEGCQPNKSNNWNFKSGGGMAR